MKTFASMLAALVVAIVITLVVWNIYEANSRAQHQLNNVCQTTLNTTCP